MDIWEKFELIKNNFYFIIYEELDYNEIKKITNIDKLKDYIILSNFFSIKLNKNKYNYIEKYLERNYSGRIKVYKFFNNLVDKFPILYKLGINTTFLYNLQKNVYSGYKINNPIWCLFGLWIFSIGKDKKKGNFYK